MKAYDKFGFDENGINKYTGTKYDVKGFNKNGYTHDGFDRKGINKDTGTKYDKDGYNILGYDKDGYNRKGYDKDGYNRKGFAHDGFHRDTGTKFDPEGYNRSGYNAEAFNREGINRITGTRFDKKGFDINGIHETTGTKYGTDGYDKTGYDKNGFNKKGKHIVTKTIYDEEGYDKDGYNRRYEDRAGNIKENAENLREKYLLKIRLAKILGTNRVSIGRYLKHYNIDINDLAEVAKTEGMKPDIVVNLKEKAKESRKYSEPFVLEEYLKRSYLKKTSSGIKEIKPTEKDVEDAIEYLNFLDEKICLETVNRAVKLQLLKDIDLKARIKCKK